MERRYNRQDRKLCNHVETVREFTYLGDRVSVGGGCGGCGGEALQQTGQKAM